MDAHPGRRLLLTLLMSVIAAGVPAKAQEPVVGQPGKDVVYVPTPATLVEKMLDLAAVTPEDYVIDLGSGDGRIVIAAAKRRARALGIEFDPGLIEVSRREALSARVSDRATFVEADLFKSDFSQASVLTMFLLPDIMLKLRPTILDMKPGTRVVSNSFEMEGWAPDDSATADGCETFCTAHLWIVPAKVGGTWRFSLGELALKQDFQLLAGTLTPAGDQAVSVTGRLRGEQINFSAAGVQYAGRVTGNTMRGTVTGRGSNGTWSATRVGD